MKVKKIIEFIEMCAGVAVIAFGVCLMIKSGLGQTAYIAFASDLSKVAGYKVGSVIIFFNIACLFGQMIIMRKEFKPIQMLQALVAYLNGLMVNIFCYDFWPTANLVPRNYAEQWVLFLGGLLIISFGVAMMRSANSLNMPLEEFAYALSRKINRPLPVVRQTIDIVSILGCIVTIFLFDLDYSSIREGTWCSMLLLGYSMTYTIPITDRVLQYINQKIFKHAVA